VRLNTPFQKKNSLKKKLYGYNSPLYLIIVFIFAYLRGWEQVLADKMKMARANDKRLR